MSTFDGLVDEFPDIRIDYFRTHKEKKPPAACFLSHVHSDHLLGLESLKMPFIYCSTATKNLLLRMEKYPHRINFQKGILEVRKQTYRHLNLLLRPLPLQAPVELELGPKTKIRVTLFDANHCPGAVMFLIEDDNRAILYTGDVRAEVWWVNSIVRNPILLQYSTGSRRLDCIYLDTTFASHKDVYAEFPTKAEGLKELLDQVQACAKSSIFYFRAWTLGYEDVWIALAHHLKTRVHVDDYQFGLFSALAANGADLGSALIGVQVGNQIHPGCLTADNTVKLHSCEPGMECQSRISENVDTVWITPIVSRSAVGVELAEIGAGAGGGDLYQAPELRIDSEAAIETLRVYAGTLVEDEDKFEHIATVLDTIRDSRSFKLPLDRLALDLDKHVPLHDFVSFISTRGGHTNSKPLLDQNPDRELGRRQKTIRFPYSRHSSFFELRHLISVFRPKDICPCTVDLHSWTQEVSMRSLFGDLCSEQTFRHDSVTRDRASAVQRGNADSGKKRKRSDSGNQSRNSGSQEASMGGKVYVSARNSPYPDDMPTSSTIGEALTPAPLEGGCNVGKALDSDGNHNDDDIDRLSTISLSPSAFDSQEISAFRADVDVCVGDTESPSPQHDPSARLEFRDDGVSHARLRRVRARIEAYRAARSCLSLDNNGSDWEDLHLRSLGWKGHTEQETVL